MEPDAVYTGILTLLENIFGFLSVDVILYFQILFYQVMFVFRGGGGLAELNGYNDSNEIWP